MKKIKYFPILPNYRDIWLNIKENMKIWLKIKKKLMKIQNQPYSSCSNKGKDAKNYKTKYTKQNRKYQNYK